MSEINEGEVQFYFGKRGKITPTKVEKHPNNAIITLLVDEGENKNTTMVLNEKAYEVLKLDPMEKNELSFSLNPSNYAENMVINANGFESKLNIIVRKNGRISHKKTYNDLRTRYGVDSTIELELEFTEMTTPFQGNTVFKLKRFFTNDEMNEEIDESLKQELTL